jgi:BirA family transcriptional regulator, biotin operon repressor / biotin---[acetyl-CoA-carboxylase] ligase
LIFTQLIKENLKTQFIGRELEYKSFTDSTNSDIWKLVSDNKAKNGTLIITDDQRKGKGRRENTWISSPEKNLSFSFLLIPQLENTKFGLLSLLSGVGMCEGIEQSCGIVCKLKWPNDILIKNKKVGGILIETKEINNKFYICIGIGLNVNDDLSHFPINIKNSSTSLYLENNQLAQRELLLSTILISIENLYLNQIENICEIWMKYCGHINSIVSFNFGHKLIKGKFVGINLDGYAKIKTEGELKIYPGGELKL